MRTCNKLVQEEKNNSWNSKPRWQILQFVIGVDRASGLVTKLSLLSEEAGGNVSSTPDPYRPVVRHWDKLAGWLTPSHCLGVRQGTRGQLLSLMLAELSLTFFNSLWYWLLSFSFDSNTNFRVNYALSRAKMNLLLLPHLLIQRTPYKIISNMALWRISECLFPAISAIRTIKSILDTLICINLCTNFEYIYLTPKL